MGPAGKPRGSVKPGLEAVVAEQAARLLREEGEDLLSDILGGVMVPAQLPACGAKHEPEMPADEGFKGGFIPAGREAPEQFLIFIVHDVHLPTAAGMQL
jgi:hypothetical protein